MCRWYPYLAVPVKAGSEIIGAISFSYGDPPKEDTKLKEIAARYNVGKDKLFLFANAYKSRPRFIVETLKTGSILQLVKSVQL
jgi:hypothetical protein